MSWTSVADRQKLSRLIQVTLARFEPRISRLKVIPLESAGAARHVLRFQIEGLLDMDPAPEHISFDTVLQLSSGDYQVKGDPSAG
jgi:type VI secretion system protein ImpF